MTQSLETSKRHLWLSDDLLNVGTLIAELVTLTSLSQLEEGSSLLSKGVDMLRFKCFLSWLFYVFSACRREPTALDVNWESIQYEFQIDWFVGCEAERLWVLRHGVLARILAKVRL